MKQKITVLLAGAAGQVGTAIQTLMKNAPDIQLHCYTYADLDITDFEKVKNVFAKVAPNVVINCAAYTAVDKAETEKEKAFAVNTTGAAHLARASNQFNCTLVHLSTDYVFSGNQTLPRIEIDSTCPINYYGETKCWAEESIRQRCDHTIILRVSGVFSAYGHNFLKTMLHLTNTKSHLTVVDDQITCPTYAGDIAQTILDIIRQGFNKFGVYHYTNKTPVSWYDFAKAIIHSASEEFNILEKKSEREQLTLSPIATINYPTPAKRPSFAVLNCDKILRDYGIEQQHWQKGLEQSLAIIAKRTGA